MAWLKEESGTGSLKPTWEYRKGVNCVTILPNQTREFVLLTGENDATNTWSAPVGMWIHSFPHNNGFSTVVCNKWKEACPMCFENEIYKRNNPNYKQTNGRLPYGLSKKAVVQVWDKTEQKVLWLIAGQKIIEGMNFIIERHAVDFDGGVAITRTGEKLNTSYRVDLAKIVLSTEEKKAIAEQIIPYDMVDAYWILSREELVQKSGIQSGEYFSRMIPNHPEVDISSWGVIPSYLGGQVASPVVQVSVPVVKGTVVISEEVLKALNTKCTLGVYIGKELNEVVKATGQPYIQYLLRSGSDVEKSAAQTILDNWDVVNVYIRQGEF